MKKIKTNIYLSLIIAVIMAIFISLSCSDDDSTTPNTTTTTTTGTTTTTTGETTTTTTTTQQGNATTTTCCIGGSCWEGTSKYGIVDFINNLSGFIRNDDSIDSGLEGYHIYMWFPESMNGQIGMRTGVGMEAVDLGATQTFDEVTTAPDSGQFLQDDVAWNTGTGFVIGGSWFDGHHTGGLDMTNNIYVIKLPNGHYVKMEVLSAEYGTVEIKYFYQSDGSTNLATSG